MFISNQICKTNHTNVNSLLSITKHNFNNKQNSDVKLNNNNYQLSFIDSILNSNSKIIIKKNKKLKNNPFMKNIFIFNNHISYGIILFIILISSIEANHQQVNISDNSNKHSQNDFSKIDKCHLIPSKDQVFIKFYHYLFIF